MHGVLIYDGDCGFCTSSASLAKRLLVEPVRVLPWQALDLDALGLTVADVSTAAYFVDTDGSTHRGHLAVGRSLEHMAPPLRPIGRLIQHRPLSWLAGPTYRVIARFRYRLPGSTDACRIDKPSNH